jgi:hypothetical protein
VILVPRATIWPGQLPTNSTGTPRPLLAPARPFLTVHYTGAGSWLDPDDSPTELRAIQAYAKNAGKPWEYNYVIDGQGIVFEYAGDYRAAHTAGWNESAVGVLLLVGFTADKALEQPPVEMVVAFRDLRAWLVDTGRIAPDHALRQHREMPGAATLCPGAAVIAKWPALSAPVPPPPTPPPLEDDNMYIATLDDGTVCVVGSSVRPVSIDEITDGGPLAGLPRYAPEPESYWHAWLAAGVLEYSARVRP